MSVECTEKNHWKMQFCKPYRKLVVVSFVRSLVTKSRVVQNTSNGFDTNNFYKNVLVEISTLTKRNKPAKDNFFLRQSTILNGIHLSKEKLTMVWNNDDVISHRYIHLFEVNDNEWDRYHGPIERFTSSLYVMWILLKLTSVSLVYTFVICMRYLFHSISL